MRKDKAAAIVTVHRAPAMTRRGRKAIAAWLRRQAFLLEQHGELLANRFTARYRYR